MDLVAVRKRYGRAGAQHGHARHECLVNLIDGGGRMSRRRCCIEGIEYHDGVLRCRAGRTLDAHRHRARERRRRAQRQQQALALASGPINPQRNRQQKHQQRKQHPLLLAEQRQQQAAEPAAAQRPHCAAARGARGARGAITARGAGSITSRFIGASRRSSSFVVRGPTRRSARIVRSRATMS